MINLDPIHAATLVKTAGSRMEHDTAYFSLYMGVPFSIDDQWIGYLNDKCLNIFSWSLKNGVGVSSAAIAALIELARTRNLEWIEFWGAGIVLPTIDPQIAVTHWRDAPENREVQLTISLANWQASRRQKEVRKARHNGLLVRPYAGNRFRPEHQALLDRLLANKTVDDLSFVTCAEAFLGNDHALAFEAIGQDGKIHALGIASTSLDKMLIFHHLFHDGTAGISTLLYDHVIHLCQARSIPIMAIGYSLNAGLLDYKEKLGVDIFFPPNTGTKLHLR